MHPSQEMQDRMKRVAVAMDENPLSQMTVNHLTVALLNEIATRLEAIDDKLARHSRDQSEIRIGG